MSKHKKVATIRVEFDKGKAMRTISRQVFNLRPTRLVPDKTKYNRKRNPQRRQSSNDD